MYPVTEPLFQSTPSARRATLSGWCVAAAWQISIHALREEGDPLLAIGRKPEKNFNPRPPRGGRPISQAPLTGLKNFNPRPPRGGRPYVCLHSNAKIGISIHALREEGDFCTFDFLRRCAYFNPRPPRGGRRPRSAAIRPPARNFNPRPPRGGRLYGNTSKICSANFNPRPPRGGRLGLLVDSVL